MPLPDPPRFITRDRRAVTGARVPPVSANPTATAGVDKAVLAVPAAAESSTAEAVTSHVPVARVVIREPRPVPSQFGPAEIAERAWLNAAALRPDALVAVSSADGGVGRSTLVAALGSVLALSVPEPVLAVDMVPAPWGGLGVRVGRRSGTTVWDAVRDLGGLTTRDEAERWAQRGPTGLLALVGETEGRDRRPPHYDEAVALAGRLRRLFALTVCDLPAALTSEVWRTLAAATVPVLVARATTDGLRHVLRLLTHLSAAGHARVVRECVLVVMSTSPSVPRQVRAVVRQADDIAGAVHTVPYDPRLAQPEPVDARQLRRRTRTALVAVADAVLQRCAAERPVLASRPEERA